MIRFYHGQVIHIVTICDVAGIYKWPLARCHLLMLSCNDVCSCYIVVNGVCSCYYRQWRLFMLLSLMAFVYVIVRRQWRLFMLLSPMPFVHVIIVANAFCLCYCLQCRLFMLMSPMPFVYVIVANAVCLCVIVANAVILCYRAYTGNCWKKRYKEIAFLHHTS